MPGSNHQQLWCCCQCVQCIQCTPVRHHTLLQLRASIIKILFCFMQTCPLETAECGYTKEMRNTLPKRLPIFCVTYEFTPETPMRLQTGRSEEMITVHNIRFTYPLSPSPSLTQICPSLTSLSAQCSLQQPPQNTLFWSLPHNMIQVLLTQSKPHLQGTQKVECCQE